jgi:hypothetical protein
LKGFVLAQHDMVEVTAKLIEKSGSRAEWNAKRHPPVPNAREADSAGRCLAVHVAGR